MKMFEFTHAWLSIDGRAFDPVFGFEQVYGIVFLLKSVNNKAFVNNTGVLLLSVDHWFVGKLLLSVW